MATITLDYNTRNVQAQKALDYILSLGYFKAQEVKKTRRRISRINRLKTRSTHNDDPFAEVFGIWADRDIDGETLRKKAWGREI